MIYLKKSYVFFCLFVAIFTVFFAFFYPEFSKNALISGVELCSQQLLLAIFPFLVVAQLLVFSGSIHYLGILFTPLVKTLGYNNKTLCGIFLLQFIGGFAPATNALAQAVNENKLSKTEAEKILPIIVCMGPSFIILAVGVGMFQNRMLGIFMFLSQILACWFTGFIFRFIFPNKKEKQTFQTKARPTSKEKSSFPIIVANAFFAFLRLSSVVIFMMFFSKGLYLILPVKWHILPALILEVTAGSAFLSQNAANASYLVCACLSLQGLSVLFQTSALCPPNLSMKYLYIGRIFHLPLSLLFFRLFMLIPQKQAVYNSFAPKVISISRLHTEQALLIFVICIVTASQLHRVLNSKKNFNE